MQSLHCLPGLVAHHVRDRHETRGLAVHRNENRGLALPRQLLAPRKQTVLRDARLREEAETADEYFPALDAGAYPAARDRLENLDLGERKGAILRPSDDGLT